MFYPKSKPLEGFHKELNLEDSFSLLSWNIRKENLNVNFQLKLQELLEQHSIDFLLFQEYKISKSNQMQLKNFNFATAPNIETKNYLYGLVTASKSSIKKRVVNLSKSKEFFLATKKANLITHHHFKDEAELIVVNLHAINFVAAKQFMADLDHLQAFLDGLNCAVIVSGDFNNWNKKRFDALLEFERYLGYKKAIIEDAKNVKRLFNKPIDHIFYKNIEFIDAKALDTKKISDHNPIIATFKQLKI